MVETSAAPHSIAARYSVTEQAVQWLLDNRSGGDAETADLLKRLYKSLVYGASASPTSSPWDDVLVYDNPGDSMHVAVFGTNYQNAVKCLDGKGLYGRIFPNNETRWEGSGSTYDKHLATDTYGQTDSQYVEALRAANRSLAQAIFKAPENVGSMTIIDRIDDVQSAVDELANDLANNIESLNMQLQSRTDTLFDHYAFIQTKINDLEDRLTAGGL